MKGDVSMDDTEILELLKKRDENAVKTLLDKYGRYCYTVAYRILQSSEDAEECVNDALMKLWASPKELFPDNLRLYLAKITRNLAINKYNSNRSIKRGGDEFFVALEEISEIVSDSSDTENEIMRGEFMTSVNRFLRSVPERECGIFINRYFDLDPVKTIAENYGLRENNVLKILSRTREKLKKFLEREGYIL